MQYNYVLFDAQTDYYRIARYEIESLSNVKVRGRALANVGIIKNFLFRLHTSGRINKYIKLPFQKIWNRGFWGNLTFPEEKPVCFIFFCTMGNLPYQMDMFEYLRSRYPNCKLILWLRDMLQIAKRQMPDFDEQNARQIFDEIYTINRLDAEKYGFKIIHSFCSRYPIEVSTGDKKSDVVFIGAVKDRLDTVRRAYERFTAAGLSCDFLLINKEPIEDLPDGLIVQQKSISYTEMLKRTVNSKCILEVTQKGSDALTSRCLEALCYNKKLISDNFRLKDTKYYDPRYMYLFDDIENVDPAFILAQEQVDYNYDGDFSPVKCLELIEKDLLEIDKRGQL